MSEYKNHPVTADLIVDVDSEVLLIKRAIAPFQDMWALPGGHMDHGEETVEQCAVREAGEETGLEVSVSDLELLGVYSEPDRDPRGHYVTCAYVVARFEGEPKAADDAKDARFFSLYDLPDLAFDHERILNDYIRTKLEAKK